MQNQADNAHRGGRGGSSSFKKFDKDDKSGLKRKRSDSDSKKPYDAAKAHADKKIRGETQEMAYQAKVLWEECRNTKLAEEKREESMEKLLDLLSGKMFKMVMKRDTSRVIQTVLKIGNEKQRSRVQAELAPHALEMSKNNYAHFIVLKMLKYGSAQERAAIIKNFSGHVREFARHKTASTVLEYVYAHIAKAQEKLSLICEFYGPEFTIFRDQPKKLEEILKTFPEKKKRVMASLREFLIALTNKITGVIDNSIVHKPLLQYLENADYLQKQEIIGFLKDHIVRFLHTKDGAKAAVICIKFASTKERKDIVKACKDYTGKIAREEFGHIVLLELFASIDDTSLIKKSILSGLQAELLDLCKDKYGHLCVLATMLAPSPKYFFPKVLSLLGPTTYPDPTDATKEISTSKKDAEKRQEEIRTSFLKQVLAIVEENAYDLITDVYARTIIDEVFNLCTDEKTKEKIYDELLMWVNFDEEAHAKEIETLNKPTRKYHPMEEQPELLEVNTDLLTHSLAHRTLRKWVKKDNAFGEKLWVKIQDRLSFYVQDSQASWVILSLLENNATTKPKVLAALKKIKSSLKVEKKEATDNKEVKKTALEAILEILNNK
eukprot:TRINITY_DN5648_c0_g1_i1.p1 TRINITY_DN5648_c0_g1~~TRINITY_DN5648_c0_g1_i1.p1  ORF type:complete len:607 (+),score=195.03 TRINITY_DN5648_c0_g1_i1:272-2092(+)